MKEDLTARRQLAEDTFNKLQEQKTQKTQEIADIDAELARLQGEFRVLSELLESKDDKKKVSSKPEEINVDKALENK